MGSLYECLCEAHLSKFHTTLRLNGYTDCESLLALSGQDFQRMGIIGEEDVTRMFELINIIRSVSAEGLRKSDESLQSCSDGSVEQMKSNVSNISNDNSNYTGSKKPISHMKARTNTARVGKSLSSRVLSNESISESPDLWKSQPEPRLKQKRPSSCVSKFSKSVKVEYKSQTTSYNYGVPKSYTHAENLTAPKARSSPHDTRIKVCIRKRPVSQRELKHNDSDIVSVPLPNVIHVSEDKVAVDLTPFTMTHEFVFDEVFDETVSTKAMYTSTAKPLIEKVFHGGKATCFAFGQTGAGKTFTMLGDKGTPGLYLLAATDIFERIRTPLQLVKLQVWVSFFEIYCGQLFDLLNKRKRLHAREDGCQRVCISGLTETNVVDVNSIMKVLEFGNNVRRKGSTGVNADSSRSHAILQMELRDHRDKKAGRMSFIDLAGSERASEVIDSDRRTRMEGAEINQSLLALKECIRSIDQETKHTPFRQSKLTHILKESFIGNSVTCMIANVSPVQSACENTLNTLRYAHRVKELKPDAAMTRVATRSPASVSSTSTIFQPSQVHSSTPRRNTSVRPRSSPYKKETDSPLSGYIVKAGPIKRNISTKQVDKIAGLGEKLARRSSDISASSSSEQSDSCNLNTISEPRVKLCFDGGEPKSIHPVNEGNVTEYWMKKLRGMAGDVATNVNDLNINSHEEKVLNEKPVADVELGVNLQPTLNVNSLNNDTSLPNNNSNAAAPERLINNLVIPERKFKDEQPGVHNTVGFPLPKVSLAITKEHVSYNGIVLDSLELDSEELFKSNSSSSENNTFPKRDPFNSKQNTKSEDWANRQPPTSVENKASAATSSLDITATKTPSKLAPQRRRILPSPHQIYNNLAEREDVNLPTPGTNICDIESDIRQYCMERRLQENRISSDNIHLDKPRSPLVTQELSRESIGDTLRGTTSKAPDSYSTKPTIQKEKLGLLNYNAGDYSPVYTNSKAIGSLQKSSSVVNKEVISGQITNALQTGSLDTPTSTNTSPTKLTGKYKHALTSPLPKNTVAARLHVVMAHEEQLAKTTSLCKQEMKQLLSIKADNSHTTFDEYLSRVDTALRMKHEQIQQMRDLIQTYHQSMHPPSNVESNL